MRRPKLPYPWVRLRWKDITGLASWGSPGEIRPAVAYQEGWLIWEDAEFVIVANCYSSEGEFANRDVIPKGTIIEMDGGRQKPIPQTKGEVA